MGSKKLIILALGLAFTISFSGCIDIVPEPISTFKRIDGPIGQSEGRNLKIQEDGSILLLGSESISARTVTRTPLGTQVVTFIRQIVPSIAFYSSDGNLIQDAKHYYPNSGYKMDSSVINVKTGGPIIDIAKLPDGYVTLGTWTEATIGIGRKNLKDTTAFVDAPYIMLMDNDFNLQEIKSLNGESINHNQLNGEVVFHITPKLIQDPVSSEIFIVTMVIESGQTIQEIIANRFTYAIWKVDNDGTLQDPVFYHANDTQLDNRLVDAKFIENGNILVMSKRADFPGAPAQLRFTQIDPQSLAITSSFILNTISLPNEQFDDINAHTFFNSPSGEYVLFFMDADRPVVSRTTETFLELSFNQFGDNMLLIQSATPTSDGGFAVLVEYEIGNTGVSQTRLVKFNSDLQFLWQRDFNGYPRKIVETADQGLLLIVNPFFNEAETKTTLIKLNKDGQY